MLTGKECELRNTERNQDNQFMYFQLTQEVNIDNHPRLSHNNSPRYFSQFFFKTVAIPDLVTSIGKYAFSRCSALASIVIPKFNNSFREFAFIFCTALKNISIQKGFERSPYIFQQEAAITRY